MRVILIDPANKTVVEAEQGTMYEDLTEAVKGMIEIAHVFQNEDVLYVNEEGLLELEEALRGSAEIERAYLFDVGAHQPFAGRGIIVGEEVDGVHQSAKTSLKEIKQIIQFLVPKELVKPTNSRLQ